MQLAVVLDKDLAETLGPALKALAKVSMALAIVCAVISITQLIRMVLRPGNIAGAAAKAVGKEIGEDFGSQAAKAVAKGADEQTTALAAKFGESVASRATPELRSQFGAKAFDKFFSKFVGSSEVGDIAGRAFMDGARKAGTQLADELAEEFSERMATAIGNEVQKGVRNAAGRGLTALNAAPLAASVLTRIVGKFVDAAIGKKQEALLGEINALDHKNRLFEIYVEVFEKIEKRATELRDKNMERFNEISSNGKAAIQRHERMQSLLLGIEA